MVIIRRSVLFMPGSNARALEKAKTIDADTLVFDLEDAVAPAAKEEARALVAEALKLGGYGHRELVVRINGLDSKWWRSDVAALAGLNSTAILVPKVEAADALPQVAAEMCIHDNAPIPELWAMVETPRGFLNADTVAASHERLTTLVVGTNDLVNELRARHMPDRGSVMTALGMALLTARAHGLTILDGVYNDIANLEGFERECAYARDIGFDGKTLIHPSQVDGANKAFTPSALDIEKASALKAAYDEAEVVQKGIATFEGKMIEALHVQEADRLLAFAETLAAR